MSEPKFTPGPWSVDDGRAYAKLPADQGMFSSLWPFKEGEHVEK